MKENVSLSVPIEYFGLTISDYGSANAALSGSNAYVDKFLRVLEVFGK